MTICESNNITCFFSVLDPPPPCAKELSFISFQHYPSVSLPGLNPVATDVCPSAQLVKYQYCFFHALPTPLATGTKPRRRPYCCISSSSKFMDCGSPVEQSVNLSLQNAEDNCCHSGPACMTRRSGKNTRYQRLGDSWQIVFVVVGAGMWCCFWGFNFRVCGIFKFIF